MKTPNRSFRFITVILAFAAIVNTYGQKGYGTEYSIGPRLGFSPSSGLIGIEWKQSSYSFSMGYGFKPYDFEGGSLAFGLSKYHLSYERTFDLYTTVFAIADEKAVIGITMGVRFASPKRPLDLKIGIGVGRATYGGMWYVIPELVFGIPIMYR